LPHIKKGWNFKELSLAENVAEFDGKIKFKKGGKNRGKKWAEMKRIFTDKLNLLKYLLVTLNLKRCKIKRCVIF
jgi:hypothetical protein